VARDPDIAQTGDLAQFRAVYEQAYRLKPDVRFTLALAELEHLLTGQPRPTVEARFQDGHWLLLSQGAEVGSLPEFPDFSQALALLEARARKLGLEKLSLTAEKDTAGELPLPLGRETLETLHRLNQTWASGPHSASALHEAARALAALSFQLVDLTETADEVPARALAHLALARVATGQPLTEEQVLLAQSLGHARAARRLAQELPEDALVRLYISQDDSRLQARLEAEAEPGLAHYLWLRRLAEVGGTERARRMEQLDSVSAPGLLQLSARLRIHDFENDRTWGSLAPVLLLRELAAASGNPGADERTAAEPATHAGEELKRQLARVGDTDAFFLDAEAERAWFQGLFFSAQYKLGLHLLDSLSSAQAAQEFSKSLGTPSSPAGKEFQQWMMLLTAAKSGERAEASLMQGLLAFKSFGAAPVVRVFQELQDTADWGDPALSSMTRRLVTRLDTRPEHRDTLASVAWSSLADIGLSEKLYRASLEASGSPRTEVWLAWLDRDSSKLEELLNSTDVPGPVRLQALKHLLKAEKVAPSTLMVRLSPLLAAHGDEWSFTSQCEGLLEKHQRYAEARALVERWLKSHPAPQPFERLFAQTAIARLHQLEGHAQAGWSAISPLVSSQQFGALQRAALISVDLGEVKRARSLAESAYQRYPGPEALALLSEVLWRSGAADEVPALLMKPARSLRSTDWRWEIGARFAAVFASRPVPEGIAAFEAMRKARLGAVELDQVAAAVQDAGNLELAFELESRVEAPGLQRLELLMDAYNYLQRWKSEQAALEWLRPRVPPQLLEPLSMFAFARKADAVVWNLASAPQGTAETDDYAWLMRAASSLRSRDSDPEHQAALRKRFEVERPQFYHQVGRYLLGLSSEQNVLAAAKTPQSRQELPFFLGFKAQVEGRYADAVTWYRAAVELGQPRVGEYRWSYDELSRMRSAELSLERMKASEL
jgi:hypothetical protein